MALSGTGTELILSAFGIPFFSARGITQSLDPIPFVQGNRSNLRRTIGAVLVDLTPPKFLLYATKISCKDQAPPALDKVFPGTLVTVTCVKRLSYAVGGTPNRTVFSGSSVNDGNGFISYRPVLSMMIVSLSDNFAEWEAEDTWSIEAEEVGPAP